MTKLIFGFFAAGVQVQSSTRAFVSVAARGLSLISIPRLHATSLGTRTGLLLFFPGQSNFRTGQGTIQRIPGLSRMFQDTWQLCDIVIMIVHSLVPQEVYLVRRILYTAWFDPLEVASGKVCTQLGSSGGISSGEDIVHSLVPQEVYLVGRILYTAWFLWR